MDYVDPRDSNCTTHGSDSNWFVCASTIGSSITFLCGVIGNPTPTLNQTAFSCTNRLQIISNNTSNDITIELVMELSAGNYTCTTSSADTFPDKTSTRLFQFFVGGELIKSIKDSIVTNLNSFRSSPSIK